ncbi:MAG: DUF4041 domain-containing protein [Candidatus Sumerlaeota bacterium]
MDDFYFGLIVGSGWAGGVLLLVTVVTVFLSARKVKKFRTENDALKPLERYKHISDLDAEAARIIQNGWQEGEAHKAQAKAEIESWRAWIEHEKSAAVAEKETLIAESKEQRAKSAARAEELEARAVAAVRAATAEASRIIEEANVRAREIAGKAFEAMRQKDSLEKTIQALDNLRKGYGDRYVLPIHSMLDDLGEEYTHVEAGQQLKAARESSRVMVETGLAADCEYVEVHRRITAMNFVIDAFNGKVDTIMGRLKSDNYGTLQQEVRDASALVNDNGKAFREARITEEYLLARVNELKWGAAVIGLKEKEKEEQRLIKEKIREEEKAQKEYERAVRDAEKEEQQIAKILEKVRKEAESASDEQKQKYEERLALLTQQLLEAEAKNQRALSMAQQTRAGHVYVVSNIGSFGDEVFKIGMTRRLEPMDRVKELSDASVPFDFDVHAMIYADDAPTFECALHKRFEESRINKVDYRKEFFRLPIVALRNAVLELGGQVSFTMKAEAREYHETLAVNAMRADERRQLVPADVCEAGDDDES